jgi:hypothetical protein
MAMIRKLMIGGLAALMLLGPEVSFAYNWNTHRRIAATSIGVMQAVPAAAPAPPGADPVAWAEFLAAAQAAPAKLAALRTGLAYTAPGPPQYLTNPDIEDPVCFYNEGYPLNDNSCTPAVNEADKCVFYPDDNLEKLGLFRIQDFRYVPQRSAGPCGLSPTTDPDTVLRMVIGWQAGSPDDHYDDTHLWIRPTNAGFLGKAKGWANDAWVTGAGAILAPFACAWGAIFGDGCDLDDGNKLAKKYNPVDVVDSWIPGYGDFSGDPYPTLWHFINVDAGGASLHNAPPGMHYPDAGPSHPGLMDVVIMAAAGFSGLSVRVDESDGVGNYGQYDDDERADKAWQAYDIGTVDFSPIDNLARYGWDKKFVGGGSISARGFAWPLHAIGDATAPHHVAGTSSWGHRPYEDYIDQYFEDLVNLLDGVEVPDDTLQRQRILELAFSYWMDLQDGVGVQQFVTDLAVETRFLVDVEGDWAYSDLASIKYHLGGDDAKHMSVESYRAYNSYIRGHLERAIGASLALLTFAADQALDPGFDPGIKCGTDEHYAANAGCQPGPPPPPGPQLILPGICTEGDACSNGGGCQNLCQVVTDCPPAYNVCIDGCCFAIPK